MTLFDHTAPFKRVLVVLKIAKYLAFELEGIQKKTSRLSELISRFENSKARHELVCQGVLLSMKKFGVNFDIVSLKEVNSQIKDYDLVVCLGGDGTFLHASHYILDETPIMGINTDPDRSYCSYSCYNPRIYILEPDAIWEKMINGEYEIKKRTRIEISFFDDERENNTPIVWEGNYALNEILFADNDIGRASTFRLQMDSKEFISYKGSGVIVSTGSGSTGWVKSVLNYEPEMIRDIIWEKERKLIGDKEAQSLAARLASKHFFSSSDKNLFWVIREPVIQTTLDLGKPYKGLAKEIVIQSAVKEGTMVLDGTIRRNVSFGTTFKLKAAPKPLNSVHLKF